MQCDTADDLHVEVTHAQHSFGRFSHESVRVGENMVEILAVCQSFFEHRRLRDERVVVHIRILGSKSFHLGCNLFDFFQFELVFVKQRHISPLYLVRRIGVCACARLFNLLLYTTSAYISTFRSKGLLLAFFHRRFQTSHGAGEHVHFSRARFEKHLCTLVGGCARREYIVNEKQFSSLDLPESAGKRAFEIGCSVLSSQFLLRGRVLDFDKRGENGNIQPSAHFRCKQFRLIETAFLFFFIRHRHENDDFRLHTAFEKLVRHKRTESLRDIFLFAELQGVYRLFRKVRRKRAESDFVESVF